MTLLLWLLPSAILVAGTIPLLAALRALREEAEQLAVSVRRMDHVRLAWVETGDEVDKVRRALAARRSHAR